MVLGQDSRQSKYVHSVIQFSSAQSCPTLCDPLNRSTPGLPVHHQLPEFTHTHIYRVSDAIQPSHPLSSPSPPAPNPSPNQSLFQWVNFSHEVMTPKSYFLLSTIIHCHLVLSRWIFFMLYFLNSFPGLIRLKWACKFSLLNTWSCAVMSVCENSCVFPLLPARQALLLRVSVYFLFIFPGSPSLAPASVHGLFLQMR